MNLTQREQDKLLIFVAAELARKRQARGLKGLLRAIASPDIQRSSSFRRLKGCTSDEKSLSQQSADVRLPRSLTPLPRHLWLVNL